MRERLQGRGRIFIMSGGALLMAVVLGALWGFADTTGLANVENETTTTTEVALASEQTTTTTVGQGNGVDLNVPETEATSPTTTAPRHADSEGTGGSEGSAGSPGTTSPPNQAPIIVDAGLSSDGLTLSITPTVTDPDGDDVTVTLTVNGEATAVNDGTATTVFSLSEVGYSHDATIEIRATDTAGNETVGTFSHRVDAVTTVVLSRVKFRVQTPEACFEDTAAMRLGGNLDIKGSITENIKFSEELRPDRTEVILVEEISGETVGAPGRLDVKMLGGLAGLLDLYEESHRGTGGVSVIMFEDTECKGFFSYDFKKTTR